MSIDESDLHSRSSSYLSQGAQEIAPAVEADDKAELVEELRLQRAEIERLQVEGRRIQEHLRLHDDYNSRLFHQAPIGCMLLDEEGNFDDLNAEAARNLGRVRRELIGCPLHEILTPKSRDIFKDHLEQVLSSKQARCEVVISLPGGDQRPVELRTMAVEPPLSTAPTLVTAIIDISFVKELEQQKEILEQQLRQAHRMEALGRLAGGIAHDFNNLLTLIIGYSKLAMNTMGESDPFHLHISQINKAGNHAAELIEQLLTFSRNQNVVPDFVDLNALIEDMSSMLNRITGDDVELRFEPVAGLGTVHVDGSQFKQVLLNLVVNAREAMPSGGRLVLRTRNAELQEAAALSCDLEPGSYVLVEVEDDGCGMDPATRERIFEPFFTTKSEYKSHGFGLATTYSIIAQNQGHIDVVSEVNRGTTFLIYLPRVEEGATIPLPFEEVGAETSVLCETILLVDDQSDLNSYAAMALKEYDYEVLTADSPASALAICENHHLPIDLLITDVTMPGMGGKELVERVHKLHPSIRVIYMSGLAHDVVCRERGIDVNAPFLVKPFTPEAIAAIVRETLDS